MKIQTPKTPDEALTFFQTHGSCIYCGFDIRHEIHLYNHWLKWHSGRGVRAFYKLYVWPKATTKIHNRSLCYKLGFYQWRYVRNFSDPRELREAREIYRNQGTPTAVVLCTKE